ncbi:aldehyde dehydrogenase family protein [Streptomyces syringium]|uniref:aldehyde dehydrogenase family protein n=1 Tax=Streptomyces syringium TaxID=76729 RepID=UPI00341E2AF8
MPPRLSSWASESLFGAPLSQALRDSVAAEGSRQARVESAFTGRPLVSLPLSSPADARDAVGRARAAHTAWQAVPARERTRWAVRLREQLAIRRTTFLPVLGHASGLGPADAAEELRRADDVVRLHTAAARAHVRLHRVHRAGGGIADCGCAPGGPVVVASGVDDARPLASLLEGALPALLCGSTVVTDVDARSTVTALAVAAAARGAGLPAGVWQLAVRGVSDGFDASTVRAVLAEHADGIAPQCCLCGPGGAARSRARPPGLLVVRQDGSVRAAARAAAQACFTRAGRSCAATPVIAVHTARAADFLRHFLHETRRFPPAGTVLEQRQRAPIRAWVDAGTADGARLLVAGGGPTSCRGLPAPSPTVLVAPSPRHVHAHEVPLGPVAVVAPFTHWAQVIDLARHTGPHLSVFTRARPCLLGPQLAGLPAVHIRYNQAPVAGLPPRSALRGLAWPHSSPAP